MIGKKHLIVSVLVILCMTVALAAAAFGGEKEKSPKWPTSTQVTVWWREPVTPGIMRSSTYNASGFGQLHIIGDALGLGAEETVDVRVYVSVWNDAHTVYDMIPAYMQTLDAAWPFVAVTIPVPAELFYFAAITDSETCTVTLSFYLTWA